MGAVVGAVQTAESTRSLFRELVSEACEELGHRPSLPARGYVVDLLDARVRVAPGSGGIVPGGTPAGPAADGAPAEAPDTLAEALVEALLQDGMSRWVRLRALGDRALFAAGFFADRVERTVVGAGYYAEIGRTAYARLASGFGGGGGQDAGPPDVFSELAQCFPDFVAVLADVGDRARGGRQLDLLRLYDRYRARGRESDRIRLMRHGLVPREPGEDPGQDPLQ